ncbi:MAG: rhomboid family intramembrane serine protease [Desulfuromonadales bacterium]|nr:rhomboid family intramembrane serine protease [Desulfuromonadales bacterium]
MEHTDEHSLDGHDQWQEIRYEALGAEVPVRQSEWHVRQCALVLDSRAVACQIEVHEGRWCLLVPPEQYESALHELRSFHRNNLNWPPPLPHGHPLVENTLATVSVLILLATFHNITQLDVSSTGIAMPDWVALGSAQATKILDGQWWRLVTALTLHADWAHLSANLAIGGIFTIFLCREIGSGLAWSLLLSAGALGNLVNALVQPPGHSSVGASTAVFGAVGILAAISLVRYRHNLRHRWPLPIAGALALLAVLGSEGKNTDLGAHLFGCIYGSFLGLIAEYLINRHGRPGRLANALLALASAAVVVAAWWLALTSGG